MSKILDRIQKLLKLAENAGSENEAAIAAQRARDLMLAHNISEAELRIEDPERSAEPIIKGTAFESRRRVAWRMAIVGGVDELYGCHAYWNGPRIKLFGRTSAVQAATYTSQYLMREVEALTDKLAPVGVYSRKYRNAFRLGCARRIQARILADVRARKEREKGRGGSRVTAETITDAQIAAVNDIAARGEAIEVDDGPPIAPSELRAICGNAHSSGKVREVSRAACAEIYNAHVVDAAVPNIFDANAPAPKASEGVLAVIAKDQDEVNEGYADFMYGPKNPKTGKRKRRGRSARTGNYSSGSGYEAGREAGDRVQINTARGGLPRGQDSLP